MGKITRTGSLTLAAAVAATLAVAPSALADVYEPGTPGIQRIAGPDRIDTAIMASQVQQGWTESADTVILARTDDFADALAATPLADELDAPILLTRTGSLDARTATEIERLGATTVIIAGGTGAVSAEAEAAAWGLDNVSNVYRLRGADRFETARNIAAETIAEYRGDTGISEIRDDIAEEVGDRMAAEAAQADIADAAAALDAVQAPIPGLRDAVAAAFADVDDADEALEAAQEAVDEFVAANPDVDVDAAWENLQAAQAHLTAVESTVATLSLLNWLPDEVDDDDNVIEPTIADYRTEAAGGDDDALLSRIDAAIAVLADGGIDTDVTPEDALEAVLVEADEDEGIDPGLLQEAQEALEDAQEAFGEAAGSNATLLALNAELEAASDAQSSAQEALAAAGAELDAAWSEVLPVANALQELLDAIGQGDALTLEPLALTYAYDSEDVDEYFAEIYEGIADTIAALEAQLPTQIEVILEAHAGDSTAFVTTGLDFADALSAGAAAAEEDGIILLTEAETQAGGDVVLTDVTADYIEDFDPEVHAIGGPAARALGDLADEEVRGNNRFETATLVAEEYFDLAGYEQVAVANGLDFPDAVVAAGFIANVGSGPLLLTEPTQLSDETADFLSDNAPRVSNVWVFGGTGSVTRDVSDAIDDLLDF